MDIESSIHARFNHPLIVGFECYIPATVNQKAAMVTEFVPNGSLADHLPWSINYLGSALTGETRTATIIAGIVLAMRYLHSRDIIHHDLNPGSVFVDWDWIVRIGDFSHSIPVGEAHREATFDERYSVDASYTAPECFENAPTLKSDVFSFGLILCELLSGKPGFRPNLNPLELMKQIIVDRRRPLIPDFLCDDVRLLILRCWAPDPDERPSFVEILTELDDIDFRITPGVNSEKVRRFVNAVRAREKDLGIDIDDPPWKSTFAD
jgi:serine/threonine protein kinase